LRSRAAFVDAPAFLLIGIETDKSHLIAEQLPVLVRAAAHAYVDNGDRVILEDPITHELMREAWVPQNLVDMHRVGVRLGSGSRY
ncbi:MAG TPA: hypothetical protein VN900_09985, partial [Stellaceae bacterium]|nr:hypothetical protein [Stellaceae bacterium]